jgi:hypothetical protein
MRRHLDRAEALAQCGGVAPRRVLLEMGVDADWLDMGLYYRKILPVRIGWYALPGTSPAVVAAVRAGGRLACVSALELHQGREPRHPWHIVLSRSADHRRVPADMVAHWTRGLIDGTHAAVSVELAHRQAAQCGRKAPNRSEG